MRIILGLLLLFSLEVSYAQNKDFKLIGEWEVNSVNSGDFYLNTKTDSISISEQFKEIFIDSLELDNLIKVAKDTYVNNIIEFREDGTYINSKIKAQGTYKVVQLNKKINVEFKKKVGYDMEYKIFGTLLYLTMDTYGKKTEIILAKK